MRSAAVGSVRRRRCISPYTTQLNCHQQRCLFHPHTYPPLFSLHEGQVSPHDRGRYRVAPFLDAFPVIPLPELFHHGTLQLRYVPFV